MNVCVLVCVYVCGCVYTHAYVDICVFSSTCTSVLTLPPKIFEDFVCAWVGD